MKSSVSDSIEEIELLECFSVKFLSHRYPKSFQFPNSFHFFISSNPPKILKSILNIFLNVRFICLFILCDISVGNDTSPISKYTCEPLKLKWPEFKATQDDPELKCILSFTYRKERSWNGEAITAISTSLSTGWAISFRINQFKSRKTSETKCS